MENNVLKMVYLSKDISKVSALNTTFKEIGILLENTMGNRACKKVSDFLLEKSVKLESNFILDRYIFTMIS